MNRRTFISALAAVPVLQAALPKKPVNTDWLRWSEFDKERYVSVVPVSGKVCGLHIRTDSVSPNGQEFKMLLRRTYYFKPGPNKVIEVPHTWPDTVTHVYAAVAKAEYHFPDFHEFVLIWSKT
jgi:hypothetical protein